MMSKLRVQQMGSVMGILGGGPASRTSRKREQSQAGVTLIEALVTVALIAILSVIAIPSYTSYVKKASRSDMAAALYEAASIAERQRMARLDDSYDGAEAIVAALFSTGKYSENLAEKYTVQMVLTNSDTGYYISAVPKGSGSQDGDGALALFNGSVCHYNGDSIALQSGSVSCDNGEGKFFSP